MAQRGRAALTLLRQSWESQHHVRGSDVPGGLVAAARALSSRGFSSADILTGDSVSAPAPWQAAGGASAWPQAAELAAPVVGSGSRGRGGSSQGIWHSVPAGGHRGIPSDTGCRCGEGSKASCRTQATLSLAVTHRQLQKLLHGGATTAWRCDAALQSCLQQRMVSCRSLQSLAKHEDTHQHSGSKPCLQDCTSAYAVSI